MGKIIIIAFIGLSIGTQLFAQSIPIYYQNYTDSANTLFAKKEYCKAARYYNKAFNSKDGFTIDYDRLYSAIAWAKCGELDSSLASLYSLIYNHQYSDISQLLESFKETVVMSSFEFRKLINYCKILENNKKRTFKESLAKFLDSIYIDDQTGRTIINDQVPQDPMNWVSNLRLIDSTYKVHGWLSIWEVGYKGSLVQFLVVQHSNLENQIKWKPVIKKAVDSALLAPENLALLIDRILVGRKGKQLYGTQLFYNTTEKRYTPYPIKKVKWLNKRRMKLGMINFQSYMASYN
jgi:hypothetical protein